MCRQARCGHDSTLSTCRYGVHTRGPAGHVFFAARAVRACAYDRHTRGQACQVVSAAAALRVVPLRGLRVMCDVRPLAFLTRVRAVFTHGRSHIGCELLGLRGSGLGTHARQRRDLGVRNMNSTPEDPLRMGWSARSETPTCDRRPVHASPHCHLVSHPLVDTYPGIKTIKPRCI